MQSHSPPRVDVLAAHWNVTRGHELVRRLYGDKFLTMHSLFAAKSLKAARQGTRSRYAGGSLSRLEIIAFVIRPELIRGLELMHSPYRTLVTRIRKTILSLCGWKFLPSAGGYASCVDGCHSTPGLDAFAVQSGVASIHSFYKQPDLTAEVGALAASMDGTQCARCL